MQPLAPCLLAVVLTACAASGTGDLAPDPGTPDADPVAAFAPDSPDSGPDVEPEASTMTQGASTDVAHTVDGSPDSDASEDASDASSGEVDPNAIQPPAWYDAGDGCALERRWNGKSYGTWLFCDGDY